MSDTRILDLLLDSFEGSILGLRKLLDEVARRQQSQLPLPDFIEDHFIASYIACLKGNL